MLQASHSHSLGPASDTTKTAKRTCKKPPNEVNSHTQKCPLSLLFTPVHSIAETAHQLGSRAGHCIGMTQTQHTPMTKADLPRLMTRPEVADYLNISTGTLANWNSAGAGPTPVKWNSQSVMYLPEDVLDWVHSRRWIFL